MVLLGLHTGYYQNTWGYFKLNPRWELHKDFLQQRTQSMKSRSRSSHNMSKQLLKLLQKIQKWSGVSSVSVTYRSVVEVK